MTETVVAFDAGARTLTYEAGDGMPAFFSRARNRWQVTAITDTSCRAAFQAQLEVRGPVGVLARRWLLARVGRDGRHLLDDLKHYVEHGTPSPRKQHQLDRARARRGNPVAAIGIWPSTRRLRSALRANAVFSMTTGLALTAAGWWLAGPWGIRPALLAPLVGAGVALFGVLVARAAVQPAGPLRRRAGAVVVADLAWVAGSGVLLAGNTLTSAGATAVAAGAAAVTALAAWQLAGLAAARAGDPLADLDIVESTRVLPAAPDAVWPVLTDHDLYGRLAPTLSTVEVTSGGGQPLRRRCTNTAGHSWGETCTLWDDGHRFAVHVDTSDYPYPLRVMRGLWQVDPDPRGSRVTMRFAYQAQPSVRGGLFAIALRALSPAALYRIHRGWRRAVMPPYAARRSTSGARMRTG